MSEFYRQDIGQVYGRYRPYVAPFYPTWFLNYQEIARRSNLNVSENVSPYALEQQTFSQARNSATKDPLKMIVLMGPLCVGKSLIF